MPPRWFIPEFSESPIAVHIEKDHHLGGIARRVAHRRSRNEALNVVRRWSRSAADGKRVYFNELALLSVG